MTKGAKFRLSQATYGVDSDKHPIRMPVDSVIEILTGEENRENMVEVDWNGTIVNLFLRDIQDRGIPVEPSH